MLDLGGRDPGHRSEPGGPGFVMQARLGDIIAIAHASLGGMRCDHAMAGIAEQEILQEVICLLSGQGLVGLVSRQLLLNGLEQGSVQDRRLFSGQDLTPVFDLANEKPVAEEVGEGSSSERDASAGLARAEDPCLTGMRLAFDVGRGCLVLSIQRVEILIETLVGRDPRIDRAADPASSWC